MIVIDYFKWIRKLSRDWNTLDWICAPIVVPLVTLGLLLICYWPRPKKG